MYMTKKTLLFFLSVLFVSSLVFGQAGTTGEINGTVTDPDGALLPGITVILKSPALVVEQMTTVTNANGKYRFHNLAPGNYELTFMLEGMNTLVRKGIVVSIGMAATVDIGMTLKTQQESIVVSGQAPTVDRQRTSASSNMDLEFLKSIPSGRSMDDYFNMAPGVTADSAHGSPTIGNSYNLDGVNLGDAATGTQGVYFGIDIMEEMSVTTGGLSAEYGSVQGAVVNVVSKSGGNKFSGMASFYLDHESLQSDNAGGTEFEGRKVGAKIKYEPVLNLGGPIIKNKLWFFMNGSFSVEEAYEPGYPYDQEEEIAPKRKLFYPYVKLTYSPNQNDKFVLSYNFYDSRNDHREASQYFKEDGTVKQTNATHTFNARWTHLFGDNFYTNLKVAVVRRDFLLRAKIDEAQYYDVNTGIYWGGYWRNHDDNGRDRNQVNLDVTAFVDNLGGSHELKFGAEYQMFDSYWYIHGSPDPVTGNIFVAMDGDDYYYGLKLIDDMDRKEQVVNMHAFLQDTWSVSKNLTLNLGLRYEYNSLVWPVQGKGVPETYDIYTVDRSVYKRTTAYKWNNIVPRFGAIYDLFADGTTLLKASFGRYIIPNQMGFANLAHPNGWFGVLEFFSPDGQDVLFYIPWAIPGSRGATIGYKDYDMKAAYTDELTVSLERELFEDWSISLRFIKKWDKDLIHKVDAAQLDIDKLMENGELDWSKNWVEVSGVDTYDGSNVTFYSQLDTTATQGYIVNPPGAERNYSGLELHLKKRYSHGWAINMSYVYANSKGLISTARGGEALSTSDFYSNPNYHVNRDGRLPLERRHQFKVQGLMKGPWGINISGYFRAMSGQRYTRAIRSRDLGVATGGGNQTILAEERGSNGYPFLSILDLRLEKAFKINNVNLSVFVDCFNVLNNNKALDYYTTSSNPARPFGMLEGLQDPRIFRLGARIEFNQ